MVMVEAYPIIEVIRLPAGNRLFSEPVKPLVALRVAGGFLYGCHGG
jgi:hypothetical protein